MGYVALGDGRIVEGGGVILKMSGDGLRDLMGYAARFGGGAGETWRPTSALLVAAGRPSEAVFSAYIHGAAVAG